MNDLIFRQGKGKRRRDQKGKGKGAEEEDHFFCRIRPDIRHRAHARTHARHETKRFPGWTHPPTSDLEIILEKI